MKRKLLILLPIPLLIVAGILWPGSESPILIEGKLSREDILHIKKAVRSDMRHNLLTNFSTTTLKQLPQNLHAYFGYKVVAIDGAGSICYVTLKRNYDWHYAHYVVFELRGQTNGWRVTSSQSPPWP